MDITKHRLNGRNQREEENKEESICGTCVTERQENKFVFINSKMINSEDLWLRLRYENNVNNLLDSDIKDRHYNGKTEDRKERCLMFSIHEQCDFCIVLF